MQDNEKLDKTLELFYNRFNKFNTKVLKEFGKTIKSFDEVEYYEALIIAQELQNKFIVDELLNELDRINYQTIKDINKLYDITANQSLNDSKIYYDYRNKDFIKYKDNIELQSKINTIKKDITNILKDLPKSKNIGFVMEDNNGNKIYRDLRNTYNSLIEKAIENVSVGKQDYQSAMRDTIKQLADSGVKIHEEKLTYKSGYNRRIDSSVRQDILSGLRKVNAAIQEKVAEELGTDGVEISAHFPCAEDHLDIQGRQFSNEKFEELNSELDRPIGEYNCRHSINYIILGVDLPSYSNKMLKDYKKRSLEKVNYNGKEYTKYEATQVQRQLETAIRKQKDRQIIARASGDKEEIGLAQQKITQLTTEYNKFSRVANLDIYKNRISVSGYRPVKVN